MNQKSIHWCLWLGYILFQWMWTNQRKSSLFIWYMWLSSILCLCLWTNQWIRSLFIDVYGLAISYLNGCTPCCILTHSNLHLLKSKICSAIKTQAHPLNYCGNKFAHNSSKLERFIVLNIFNIFVATKWSNVQ
jgi:hypothetical protein